MTQPTKRERGDRGQFHRSLVGTAVTPRRCRPARERDAINAVAALARLDDETLRALGIPSRSDIAWTVRYCIDC
ncbi:MAG: hypothetical protein HZA66_20695 [Rhodopseudomonas palustris]|uniref:DUF1127 domain-containing protein n=1 Tax=Rhodopseudomonas palustris TaxID=1076 RepID=A0A933S0X5_RHOPL|nr:hypothetical protein [Rhodopseudomonas palustris]